MESVKNFIKKNKFFPSKKMGQNFLSDSLVIESICNNIPNLDEYDCILEIGPGLGAITNYLISTNKPVISIELDKRLYQKIKTTFSGFKNFTVINDDFLETNLDKITTQYHNIIVVANIPYSITTPILLKCLKFNKIQALYIMVQKEVADKLVYSKPSNRNASTNSINYYFDIKKVLSIKKTSFTPQPKVDSFLIFLKRKNQKKYDHNFYLFMRPFFLSKRKKLLNNLPPLIDKNKMMLFLNKLGFNSNTRAEELNYNHWMQIYSEFKK